MIYLHPPYQFQILNLRNKFRNKTVCFKMFWYIRWNSHFVVLLPNWLPSLNLNGTSDNPLDKDVVSALYNFALSSIASTDAFSLANHIAFSSSISRSALASCCQARNEVQKSILNEWEKNYTKNIQHWSPLPTPPFLLPTYWPCFPFFHIGN